MQYDTSRWEHDHVFDQGNAAGKRSARAVADRRHDGGRDRRGVVVQLDDPV